MVDMDGDGIPDAFEGTQRVLLMEGARIIEAIMRRYQKAQEEAARQDSQIAARARARLSAESSQSYFRLSAVMDDRWWDKASKETVSDYYAEARAWKDVQPRFDEFRKRIEDKANELHGMSPEDMISNVGGRRAQQVADGERSHTGMGRVMRTREAELFAERHAPTWFNKYTEHVNKDLPRGEDGPDKSAIERINAELRGAMETLRDTGTLAHPRAQRAREWAQEQNLPYSEKPRDMTVTASLAHGMDPGRGLMDRSWGGDADKMFENNAPAWYRDFMEHRIKPEKEGEQFHARHFTAKEQVIADMVHLREHGALDSTFAKMVWASHTNNLPPEKEWGKRITPEKLEQLWAQTAKGREPAQPLDADAGKAEAKRQELGAGKDVAQRPSEAFDVGRDLRAGIAMFAAVQASQAASERPENVPTENVPSPARESSEQAQEGAERDVVTEPEFEASEVHVEGAEIVDAMDASAIERAAAIEEGRAWNAVEPGSGGTNAERVSAIDEEEVSIEDLEKLDPSLWTDLDRLALGVDGPEADPGWARQESPEEVPADERARFEAEASAAEAAEANGNGPSVADPEAQRLAEASAAQERIDNYDASMAPAPDAALEAEESETRAQQSRERDEREGQTLLAGAAAAAPVVEYGERGMVANTVTGEITDSPSSTRLPESAAVLPQDRRGAREAVLSGSFSQEAIDGQLAIHFSHGNPPGLIAPDAHAFNSHPVREQSQGAERTQGR